jgi:hypothetical protein
MQETRGRGSIAPLILDLGTRWGWVVSVTPRPLFTSRTHWIEGSVDLRADPEAEARGRVFASAGDRAPVVQPVSRHYINWATPAPIHRLTRLIFCKSMPDRYTAWQTYQIQSGKLLCTNTPYLYLVHAHIVSEPSIKTLCSIVLL